MTVEETKELEAMLHNAMRCFNEAKENNDSEGYAQALQEINNAKTKLEKSYNPSDYDSNDESSDPYYYFDLFKTDHEQIAHPSVIHAIDANFHYVHLLCSYHLYQATDGLNESLVSKVSHLDGFINHLETLDQVELNLPPELRKRTQIVSTSRFSNQLKQQKAEYVQYFYDEYENAAEANAWKKMDDETLEKMKSRFIMLADFYYEQAKHESDQPLTQNLEKAHEIYASVTKINASLGKYQEPEIDSRLKEIFQKLQDIYRRNKRKRSISSDGGVHRPAKRRKVNNAESVNSLDEREPLSEETLALEESFGALPQLSSLNATGEDIWTAVRNKVNDLITANTLKATQEAISLLKQTIENITSNFPDLDEPEEVYPLYASLYELKADQLVDELQQREANLRHVRLETVVNWGKKFQEIEDLYSKSYYYHYLCSNDEKSNAVLRSIPDYLTTLASFYLKAYKKFDNNEDLKASAIVYINQAIDFYCRQEEEFETTILEADPEAIERYVEFKVDAIKDLWKAYTFLCDINDDNTIDLIELLTRIQNHYDEFIKRNNDLHAFDESELDEIYSRINDELAKLYNGNRCSESPMPKEHTNEKKRASKKQRTVPEINKSIKTLLGETKRLEKKGALLDAFHNLQRVAVMIEEKGDRNFGALKTRLKEIVNALSSKNVSTEGLSKLQVERRCADAIQIVTYLKPITTAECHQKPYQKKINEFTKIINTILRNCNSDTQYKPSFRNRLRVTFSQVSQNNNSSVTQIGMFSSTANNEKPTIPFTSRRKVSIPWAQNDDEEEKEGKKQEAAAAPTILKG